MTTHDGHEHGAHAHEHGDHEHAHGGRTHARDHEHGEHGHGDHERCAHTHNHGDPDHAHEHGGRHHGHHDGGIHHHHYHTHHHYYHDDDACDCDDCASGGGECECAHDHDNHGHTHNHDHDHEAHGHGHDHAHDHDDHDHDHAHETGGISINHHEESTIAVFRKSIARPYAEVVSILESRMGIIAGAVSGAGGVIGHIKAVVIAEGDRCMLSITDAGTPAQKRDLGGDSAGFELVCIVFLVADDELRRIIAGAFEEFMEGA